MEERCPKLHQWATTKMSNLEPHLLSLISESPKCTELGLSASLAERFGIQITERGQIAGIWSEMRGRLVFRNLSSWQIHTWADTAEDALAATIQMAERRRWVA